VLLKILVYHFSIVCFLFQTDLALAVESPVRANLAQLKNFLAVSSSLSAILAAQENKEFISLPVDFQFVERVTVIKLAKTMASALCKFYGFDKSIRFSLRASQSNAPHSETIWMLTSSKKLTENPLSPLHYEEIEFHSKRHGVRIVNRQNGVTHYALTLPPQASAFERFFPQQKTYSAITQGNRTFILNLDEYEQIPLQNWIFSHLICEGDPKKAGALISWRLFQSITLEQSEDVLSDLGATTLSHLILSPDELKQSPEPGYTLMSLLGSEVYLSRWLSDFED
jgi:hypothetical protein